MDVYVARQPIFDTSMNIFAYELFFRSGLDNFYDSTCNCDHSTARVINDSLMVFGLDRLTCGKPAFINFTKKLLLRGAPLPLPKELLAIEVLEDIEPDDLVIKACRELKKNGYLIVLDDFVLHDIWRPLLDVADIIKVDFVGTTAQERKDIVRECTGRGVALLAEKIETSAKYKEAVEQGYSYFQGYYLDKPVVLHGRDVPVGRLSYARILREINQPDIDIKRLEEIITSDVALSYKIMLFINHFFEGSQHAVRSVRHALSLLDTAKLHTWVSLLALCEPGRQAQAGLGETGRRALLRARMCEHIAGITGYRQADCFMMGLFSDIDTLTGYSMEQVLEYLPIDARIKHALLGQIGPYRDVYELSLALEKGDSAGTAACAERLGVNESRLAGMFSRALSRVNHDC